MGLLNKKCSQVCHGILLNTAPLFLYKHVILATHSIWAGAIDDAYYSRSFADIISI